MAFNIEATAVQLDEPVCDGQTQSGTLDRLVVSLQAIEGFEDTLPFVGGNAWTAVLDFDTDVVPVADCANFNASALGGEFDGVSDEIHQDLAHARVVCLDDQLGTGVIVQCL